MSKHQKRTTCPRCHERVLPTPRAICLGCRCHLSCCQCSGAAWALSFAEYAPARAA